MPGLRPTRRHVAGGMATLGLCGLIGTSASKPAAGADDFTVGFVYIGPRLDWGWNQSFSDAAKILAASPEVMVVEAGYIPESTDYSDGKPTQETDAYRQAMERLVKPDGARLVFATSYGNDPFLFRVAKEHPGVVFRHVSDAAQRTDPQNVGSQNALINQGHYVNGVAAGLCTRTNMLGFVAGETPGSVLLNINSFLLGCRHTNPNATVRLVVAEGWEGEKADAAATNALIDAGCDVITSHLDSPKVVIETAEARGVKTCGHAIDQGPLAPNGYITGAEFKWAGMFEGFVEMARNGEPLPDFVTGGYDKGYVASSPFGAGATAEAVKAARRAIQAMKNNEPLFVGPIKDNSGKIVIPRGTSLGPYAPELQKTDYLIEGVIGSIK